MPAQRREGDFTSDTREHPSRAGPTAEAANHSLARPVHRGEPSGPFETTRAADYKALLRRRVRGVASPLPAIRHPILPWALFPSKVHSRSAPARSMPGPGRHRRAEARDALGARRLLRPSEHRWDPSDDCPSWAPPRWGDETSPGAEADHERRAFSARRPRPGTAPCDPRSGRSRFLEKQGSVAGVCPEARS